MVVGIHENSVAYRAHVPLRHRVVLVNGQLVSNLDQFRHALATDGSGLDIKLRLSPTVLRSQLNQELLDKVVARIISGEEIDLEALKANVRYEFLHEASPFHSAFTRRLEAARTVMKYLDDFEVSLEETDEFEAAKECTDEELDAALKWLDTFDPPKTTSGEDAAPSTGSASIPSEWISETGLGIAEKGPYGNEVGGNLPTPSASEGLPSHPVAVVVNAPMAELPPSAPVANALASVNDAAMPAIDKTTELTSQTGGIEALRTLPGNKITSLAELSEEENSEDNVIINKAPQPPTATPVSRGSHREGEKGKDITEDREKIRRDKRKERAGYQENEAVEDRYAARRARHESPYRSRSRSRSRKYKRKSAERDRRSDRVHRKSPRRTERSPDRRDRETRSRRTGRR